MTRQKVCKKEKKTRNKNKKNPRIIRIFFANAVFLKIFTQHVPTMLCNLNWDAVFTVGYCGDMATQQPVVKVQGGLILLFYPSCLVVFCDPGAAARMS